MVVCHCDPSACMLADTVESVEVQPELTRMEAAVQQLLVGVGEDPAREGLVDTPRRVAKAWLDMTRGSRQECKSAFGTALFHEPIVAAGSDGLVIVRDITFVALSEVTLLPFHGRCHIAYVPRHGVVLGLSKLARVTKCLAARLQTQEQFTQRLIAAVHEEVQALGVAAVVQAVHIGMGPAPTAHTTTAAAGCFADPTSGPLLEFLALLRLGGHVAMPAAGFGVAAELAGTLTAGVAQQQQQQQQLDVPASSSMAVAADALLQCVGEDPARKGLKGGAMRYASWLAAATAGYRMQLPDASAAAAAAAVELGPPTPDDRSPDPSDASSDDMSADLPCYLALRETAGACSSGGRGGSAGHAMSQQQQQQQHGPWLERLQTFSTPFSSQCEHHLLPFYGRLKLAYLPAAGCSNSGVNAVIDSSSSIDGSSCPRAALAHIVEMFSRRLQVQERLTHQVADAVVAALGAQAVLVVVESAHMCMVARGVEKHASTTLTTAARGSWAGDAAVRAVALEALLDAYPHTHLR